MKSKVLLFSDSAVVLSTFLVAILVQVKGPVAFFKTRNSYIFISFLSKIVSFVWGYAWAIAEHIMAATFNFTASISKTL